MTRARAAHRPDRPPGLQPVGLEPVQHAVLGLAVVGVQVGYAIADITAKAGFGVLIYLIAVRKTEALSPSERAEQERAALVTA